MSFAPGVHALPPGVPFARAFAHGLQARFGDWDPAAIARIQILVNTSLARQTIEHALADAARGPCVLPRFVLMSELHADPLRLGDWPMGISAGRRRLRLTRLVERFLEATGTGGTAFAPTNMAVDLADELALLIDQFHDEGVDPARLDTALSGTDLTEEAAQHWAATVRFVDIVRKLWPDILSENEGGLTDARARQRAAIEAQLAAWREDPPKHPVIAAASTGSVGSTAELMAGVAALPNGAVVLPGFDPGTPPDIWEHAGPDHPLGPFRRFFDLTGQLPTDVRLWTDVDTSERARLMAQAMRPAPVTDFWHAAAGELRDLVPGATAGLSLLEAASPQEEAGAIALAIRDAIATPDRTVTLITPDANLARRVTAALKRFEIIPDDTMGRPLVQTPPGVLMRMAAELARGPMDPVRIAAMLQHPLVQPGVPRADHLRLARAYERAVLRREIGPCDDLPPWPDAPEGAEDWRAALSATIAPLADLLRRGAPLVDLLAAHQSALTDLTTAEPGADPAIWREPEGESLEKAMTTLAAAADAYGDGAVNDYPALIQTLLQGEQLTPRTRESHPRVSFSGPREARLISADLVILAGLEDGTWPALPDPGPWMNRQMRVALGLPLPERAVGLSAHDFVHGACAPEVILSRAVKRDGAATVASRWLIRLETLVSGVGAEDHWREMQARGARWCAEARYAARPLEDVPRAERPRPVPPAEARPRKLSVTGIELLIRDAYAIYARDILRLRPLDPLGRGPDARDRGTLLHGILEEFVAATEPWPGEEAALDQLCDIADTHLATEVAAPDLRRTWRARFRRAARWFVGEEAKRRATGSPVALERRGEMNLDLPGGPFRLTAKADRIDQTNTGGSLIIDYKTGAPPGEKEIRAGMAHQLHLQAAILAAGGFEGLPTIAPEAGAYIGMTGSKDGGVPRPVDDLAETVPRHLDDLRRLLSSYDAGAPYVSRGRPQFITFAGDYDHLARLAEWSDEDAP